jgi:hypothetical protein
MPVVMRPAKKKKNGNEQLERERERNLYREQD